MPDIKDRLQVAITERYVLGREIGRGGMATVYLAHDVKHDRPIAVKVLHPDLVTTLGPERFRREIRVAAQLQHPHILPVYDSGAGEGVLWFTMPYVAGETLRDRLRRSGPFPVQDVLRIIGDVARALAYAHRRGVIHRDVKPENVMLSDETVFLADFGVAKPLESAPNSSLTVPGLIVGTPAYMAPEQALGDPATDHRADLYSLGVVAYELLAGEPPFANLTLGQLLAAHETREPESVERRRPEVAGLLAASVARCLRRDPAERWGSAEALISALRMVVASPNAVSNASVDTNVLESVTVLTPLPGVDRARAAFGRAAWREAYDHFVAAAADAELEAEDLERLGEAAWWVSDGRTSVRAREQAYRRYVKRGELRRAARVALLLAEESFHRLARSVGQGWLRQAERHLGGLPDSPEHGWLCRVHMAIALQTQDRLQDAMQFAERALDIARRVGDTDLEALALQDRGRVLIALGRVTDGMALIDEAMAFVTSGALTPLTTGRAYCNMMSTCDRLGDVGRAAEWQEAAQLWSEPHAESGFPGMCRVHRAGVLRLRGAFPEAEQEARRAAEEMEGFLVDVAGEAFYERAEIRRRMGDLAEAERMFGEAHVRGRDPLPGLALLRLAQNQGEAARSLIERALSEPGLHALERARLLPALVEIAAASGAIDVAADGASELEAITATYTSRALVASAAHAHGLVELARGEAKQAITHLRRARRIWTELDLPFELAHTRLLLSSAHERLGETDEAAMEARAARTALSRIGVAT